MDDTMLNLLQTMLGGIATAGAAMTGKLASTGMAIFSALVVVTTLWLWIQFMVDQDDLSDVAGKLVKHILNIIIISLMLTTYTNGTIGTQKVFVEGSEYLVQKITGNTSDNAFKNGVAQFNDVLKKLDAAKVSGGTADINAGIWDQAKMAVKSGLSVFTSFISAIIGLVVALALAFSMLIYISIYMLGTIMLYIGITMGPFMIPWKIWEPSSHMFDSWLRFTTAAAFFKVICSIVLGLMGGVMSGLVTAVEGMNTVGSTAAGYDILYSCGVLIFTLFISFILWQVPTMASGLVSGSARANAQWMSGRNLIGKIIK